MLQALIILGENMMRRVVIKIKHLSSLA